MRQHRIFLLSTVALFATMTANVYAAWNTPVGSNKRIAANPVNGSIASVEAVWSSGSYDLVVKFKDDTSTDRTKTISSVGTDQLYDHKPVCAVDPVTGDVAVAWVAGNTFKYKVFDSDGTTVGTTTTLTYTDEDSNYVTNAGNWELPGFVEELPTYKKWDNTTGPDKFEGWVDIVHSGSSGDGWHIAASYMYCAHSKWDDFTTEFGVTQNYDQTVLFRFATLVYENVDTAGEVARVVFSSDDLDASREYFDSPSVMQYEEWARVPAKLAPITTVQSSGYHVSGLLYTPTYGAVYEDELEWAEGGTTTGSLSLDVQMHEASVATNVYGTTERVHIAYENKIVYKAPGSGSWSSSNAIGGTITGIAPVANVLDTLYVLSYDFVVQTTYGGGAIYDEYWYYDFYTIKIRKISSIDGSYSVDATYDIEPGSAEDPAYWAFTPFVAYPGLGTFAVNESTPGTPSEFNVLFHQATWNSMNRYDEDWEADEGESKLTTDTSP